MFSKRGQAQKQLKKLTNYDDFSKVVEISRFSQLVLNMFV
jgi:hypothetical protein